MRKEVFTVGILFLLNAVIPENTSVEGCDPGPIQDEACLTKLMLQKDTELEDPDLNTVMTSIMHLEDLFERCTFTKSDPFKLKHITAYLTKVNATTKNLTLYASDATITTDPSAVLKKTVQVFLPEEIVKTKIVILSLIKLPKHFQNMSHNSLIGVRINKKTQVSGLKTPVNISVQVKQPDDRDPKCVFYNSTSRGFEDTGCNTTWNKEDGWVHCLCDHLTYFAVLMVSPKNVSKQDETILSYISLIGCSLSLLFLAITVLLYFIKWREDSDQSQQIHVSLAVALILLNLHYLVMDYAVSVYAACVYVAVLLHYSLLATFTWTAIEGFHLYLLLLRVFNIYIRRYLLKLSLVGWGFPAVIVILIFIIDKNVYLGVGLTPASSTTNTTCYITNDAVKYSTTFGFFCLIFVFNLGMLVVVVRHVFCQRSLPPGQNRKRRAKDTCTVLGITCLLGISWSLSFLSFGHLATVGLYLFCVFNTLLGFFIVIWFCIYKCTPSGSQSNVNTHSSNNATSGTSGK